MLLNEQQWRLRTEWVLTSVRLRVLDLGFNRLTLVGIKALMKSLAENASLETLTLSGNVLDTNASKAVSYALAYNRTLRRLYVDHCSLSYAAQRHIAAGIVSNSHLALRVMSGFPLGGASGRPWVLRCVRVSLRHA